MWALLPRNAQIMILVVATLVIASGLQSLQSLIWHKESWLLSYASGVATVIGSVLLVIANALWRPIWKRFPVLGRMFFPDIGGEWRGTLQTTWIDPKTKKSPGPIETKIFIRQSLFGMNLRMQTNESTSNDRRTGQGRR